MTADEIAALAARVVREAGDPGSAWHGESHWRCVAAVSARLRTRTPAADGLVCVLFALLHDSQRFDDGSDPDHGPRAAAYAASLHAGGLLPLDSRRFAVLQAAIAEHTGGAVTADPTIGTCWDADRLTLPRVGITVDPAYLSTAPARDPATIAWADRQVAAAHPQWPDLLTAAVRVQSPPPGA
ncbi:MAG: hypothetical protein U0R70_00030 [Solirubrobacteraceae bacterium]